MHYYNIYTNYITIYYKKNNRPNTKQLGGNVLNILTNYITNNIYKFFYLFLILFLIIGILSLRKLPVWCFGCSKGSWWYKCMNGTGMHYDQQNNKWIESNSCKIQKDLVKTMKDILKLLTNLILKIKNLPIILKKVIDSITNVIDNTNNKLKTNIPYIPSIPKIQNISGSCGKLPVVNIDVCQIFITPINTLIDMINFTTKQFSMIYNKLIEGLNILKIKYYLYYNYLQIK